MGADGARFVRQMRINFLSRGPRRKRGLSWPAT